MDLAMQERQASPDPDSLGLCVVCKSFVASIYKDGIDEIRYWQELHDLIRCRNSCRMCRFIFSFFEDLVENLVDKIIDQQLFGDVNPGVVGRVHRSVLDDVVGGIDFTLRESDSARYGREMKTVLWAEQGSQASSSGYVSTSPPLSDDSSPESFALIGFWLTECQQKHDECRKCMSGDVVLDETETELPKRVLFVATGSDDVRLMDTNGARGAYCTLSYCWGGPTSTQPLKTTTSNISDHLDCIKFESLPKTFQDAITVTRALKVDYIWIDSLCIIQDDENDWRDESVKMGSIYESAVLTIAASGASDTAKGCFLSRRFRSEVSLPFTNKDDEELGSIKLSLIPEYNDKPDWGPLSTRGWALQEWILSRRTLHFMPDGLYWKCKKREVDERNCHHPIPYHLEWDALLARYSNLSLTYKSDRLPAVQGIATQMQKTRDDQYLLGIWTGNLPQELLWMVESSESDAEDLPNLPTWTWASKGGNKIFWNSHLSGEEQLRGELGPEPPTFQEKDTLILQGRLKQVKIGRGGITECCLDAANATYPYTASETLVLFREEEVFKVSSADAKEEFVGLAAFDRQHHEEAYCLILASTHGARCIVIPFTKEIMNFKANVWAVGRRTQENMTAHLMKIGYQIDAEIIV